MRTGKEFLFSGLRTGTWKNRNLYSCSLGTGIPETQNRKHPESLTIYCFPEPESGTFNNSSHTMGNRNENQWRTFIFRSENRNLEPLSSVIPTNEKTQNFLAQSTEPERYGTFYCEPEPNRNPEPFIKKIMVSSPDIQSYGARNNFLNIFKNKALNKKLKRIKFISFVISHRILCLEILLKIKIRFWWELTKQINFILFNFSFGTIFLEIIEKNVPCSVRLCIKTPANTQNATHCLRHDWNDLLVFWYEVKYIVVSWSGFAIVYSPFHERERREIGGEFNQVWFERTTHDQSRLITLVNNFWSIKVLLQLNFFF